MKEGCDSVREINREPDTRKDISTVCVRERVIEAMGLWKEREQHTCRKGSRRRMVETA